MTTGHDDQHAEAQPATPRQARLRALALLFELYGAASRCAHEAEALGKIVARKRNTQAGRADIAERTAALLRRMEATDRMEAEVNATVLALRTSPGLPDDVFGVAPHIYNLTYDLVDYARGYVAEAFEASGARPIKPEPRWQSDSPDSAENRAEQQLSDLVGTLH